MRLNTTGWSGFALLVLGMLVAIGHATQNAALVYLGTDFAAMVLNSALCFIALGGCLLMSAKDAARWQSAVWTICMAVIALSLLSLAESALNRSLGVDWPTAHHWIGDGSVRPGRMPANSATGFLLGAISLLLLIGSKRAMALRLSLVAAVLVGLIGLMGLLGYGLGLHLLYGWFGTTRMALPTAFGLLLLSYGLWTLWRVRVAQYGSISADERITLVGSLVLLTVALCTGLIGFATLQEETEHQIAVGLDKNLASRQTAVESAVAEAVAHAQLFAKDPLLVEHSARLSSSAADQTSRQTLTAFLNDRMADGLAYAALRAPGGELLVEVGKVLSDQTLRADLHAPGWQLAWDGRYLLTSTVAVRNESGRIVGQLTTARALPRLQSIMTAGTGYGRTGELNICVLKAQRLWCFPDHRQAKVYEAPYVPSGPERRPMSMAVGGSHGILRGLDYRGVEVIAAYSGLPWPSMGMVLKQDEAEIYEPIAHRLQDTVILLLLLCAGGIFVLRAQVRPVAVRLVRSETQAREAHAEAAAQAQRIRAIVDNIGDGIVTMDVHGKVESINPAACRIFGYGAAELMGQKIDVLMPREMRQQYAEALKRYLAHGGGSLINGNAVVLRGLRKSGNEFPLELSVSELQQGQARVFVGVVRDISERVAAQQALNDEKERLRITLHSIGDAVITINTQGRVTYLNPVAENMTGWMDEEAYGKPVEEVFHIVHEETGELAASPVEAVLKTGEVSGLAERTELVRRDGTRISIEDSAAPIRAQDGKLTGVVIVFHDVTQAREMAAQISYQASHDALTDLYNRREFERRLALTLAGDSPANRGLSLLYMDLDQFKVVNDTCGHAAGDALLKQLSVLIRAKLRAEDSFARLGGDEFAILLNNCPGEVAQRIAESIRVAVSEFLFAWDNKNFSVGISIGLVTRENGESLSDLLKAADSACYLAKEKGRNRVHVYKREDADVMRRHGEMGWLARIEHALRADRFQLYLQPIAPLRASIAVAHYEVLIRLLDEDDNVVPPMAFIPAAERYGLMPRIDRWVVARALDLMQARREQGVPIALSINLSATSLNEETFLQFLKDQMTLRSLDNGSICFEVTETSAIANLTQCSRMMHELKALGCLFSLDDFGSGMSSFAYLKHLPVDFVKIDGSFVRDIVDDRIDRAMVMAINDIAHVMDIRTIAEFVENDQIVTLLREMGVDFAQGYGIGRPFPAISLPEMVIA